MSKFVGLRMGAVHEEHTISEYYCGGCMWPVTDHDSYCPECGGAFQKSLADDALEAENTKLLELIWDLVSYGEDAECGIATAFKTRLREVGIEVQP